MIPPSPVAPRRAPDPLTVPARRKRNVTPDRRRSTLGSSSSAPGSFRCVRCGLDVPLDAPGTAHRNHCPTCLWSRHVDDDVPGDRDSDCRASMEPIAIHVRGDGEWVLVHRCTGCGLGAPQPHRRGRQPARPRPHRRPAPRATPRSRWSSSTASSDASHSGRSCRVPANSQPGFGTGGRGGRRRGRRGGEPRRVASAAKAEAAASRSRRRSRSARAGAGGAGRRRRCRGGRGRRRTRRARARRRRGRRCPARCRGRARAGGSVAAGRPIGNVPVPHEVARAAIGAARTAGSPSGCRP